jgi:tight adherence protein C
VTALTAGVAAALTAGLVVAWAARSAMPPHRFARSGGSAAARVVALVVVGLAAAAVWPPLPVVGVLLVWMRRRTRRIAAQRARHRALVVALPDTIDLAIVAARAGLTVPMIVAELAQRAPPPVGPACAAARASAAAGLRLSDALGGLPGSVGEPVRPLVMAFANAERDGGPLLPALLAAASDARRTRAHGAEMAARRLSVRLLFPLVVCILPAFVVLGLVPLLVASFQGVRLR